MDGCVNSDLETVKATETTRRIPEMDSLRALAAVSVVVFHYSYRYGADYGWENAAGFSVPWGHYGVNLFFVISGFVITASTSRKPNPADFFTARVSRIYPAYVGAVLFASIMAVVGNLPNWQISPSTFALNLTMLNRFFGRPYVDGVYWTLTLELMFYAFVFVLLALRLWVRPWRDWALFGWAMGSLAWSMTSLSHDPAWAFRPVGLIFVYGPLFIIGIALREGGGTGRQQWVPFVLSTTVAVVAFARLVPATEFGISAACCAAVWFVSRWPVRVLQFGPLVAVGQASYVLYLIHQIPGYVVLIHLRGILDPTVAAILLMVTMILVSIPIHKRLEIPAIAWTRGTLNRIGQRRR